MGKRKLEGAEKADNVLTEFGFLSFEVLMLPNTIVVQSSILGSG